MEILEKKVKDLIPYEKNPRVNDKAVSYVANSIKEFGFKVPIVVDSNNVIVCGHTRLLAAKKLKMSTVPTITATDLTEEQIKAFRLADNKVSEQSKWNPTLLRNEIKALPSFDFTNFGFKFNTEKINERINTVKTYNLDYYREELTEGKWGIPDLNGIDYKPKDLIGFNYAKSSLDKDAGLHFYIDDYQFERLWNKPKGYIDVLKSFDCVLTPDFSLYLNMPLAMQMWNIYRSRLLGQMWQEEGLKVIPTVSWSTEDSYCFCFDGLPLHSTLSVSTVGVKRDEESLNIWYSGMDEMIRQLKPKRLLVYGGELEYNYGDIDVVYYNNKVTERMKQL